MSRFIKLTMRGGEDFYARVESITAVAVHSCSTMIRLLSDYVSVKESPEQILAMIEGREEQAPSAEPQPSQDVHAMVGAWNTRSQTPMHWVVKQDGTAWVCHEDGSISASIASLEDIKSNYIPSTWLPPEGTEGRRITDEANRARAALANPPAMQVSESCGILRTVKNRLKPYENVQGRGSVYDDIRAALVTIDAALAACESDGGK